MKFAHIVILALLVTGVVYAAQAPLSIQEMIQTSPKESSPPADTSVVTVRGNTIRRFALHSTARFVPVASPTVSGTVKVGSGLAIVDGVLNNTGIAGVASFNGRGGAVKPGFSDYSASMIKGLSTVAKTGSYADLTGKPPIPAAQVNSDWSASSGVAQILNKPTIPTALSQLSQDATHRTVTDTEKATWNAQSNSVNSVNGQTGTVVLSATDVGADPLGSATSVADDLNLHEGLINNPHSVTKAQVGLGNADNTADLDKPVSTAMQTALDTKLTASIFNNWSASKLSKDNPTYTGTLSTVSVDGTRMVNVRNTVAPSWTPAEGDMYTDAAGKIWVYVSSSWLEKGAAYTLPTASASSLGGVKVGSKLSIDGNGVLDVMVSSLGPTGLVTAGLAGDQTISSGFAYVTTQTGKWTFNSYTSTKQTTIFANYSGTLCAATGSKLYWPNPVTFENQSSTCAYVPKSTRVTAQMYGGKTWAAGTRNLQKVVVSESVPPAGSTIATDSFTAADDSTLDTHTGENGLTWTLHPSYTGTLMKIASNRLRGTTLGISAYYASAVPSSADYSVSADIYVATVATGDYIGVAGRMDTTANTFYYARYYQSTGLWELFKHINGTVTTLGTGYSQTLVQGNSYNVKLTMAGSSIKLFVDGVERVSATDSSITAAGRGGLRKSAYGTLTTSYHYDNFKMEQ